MCVCAYGMGWIHGQTPTLLAKIYGVYEISIRNTTTGKSFKQDVLVMENLFYNRKISKVREEERERERERESNAAMSKERLT